MPDFIQNNLEYFLFLIGFVALIKGADWLVDGASSVAKKFNTSDIVIGLTIVSFGTSLPELIINIVAGINDSPDLAIGNILGSNIANILLILGVSAAIFPLLVKKNTLTFEIPFSIVAVVVAGALIFTTILPDDPELGSNQLTLERMDGVILLSFFALFMFYIGKITKNGGAEEIIDGEITEISLITSILYIIAGIIGVGVGGRWIVNGAEKIAVDFGIGEGLVGLTIVAIGTSLPELATSAIAAYKKNADIAVGNVVGSNIFNVLWILGVSSVVKPIPTEPRTIYTDVIIVIAVSIFFFLILFLPKRNTLTRWKGWLFLLCYVGYLLYLINRESGIS